MNDAFLKSFSQKLGVTDPTTRKKVEELLRLLEVQGCKLTLSQSARAVICIDLAASAKGTTLDKKLAVKLAGLTRPQYVALRQSVSSLLNLTPKVTVAEVCRGHSVTAATHLSQQVLALYEEQNSSKEVDFSLPAYPAAAVHGACSVLKLKVNKQHLYESSGSKRKIYDRTVEAMATLAKSLHAPKAERSGKHGRSLVELVEENLKHGSPDKRRKTQEEESSAGNDFEEWKRKLLAAAASKE